MENLLLSENVSLYKIQVGDVPALVVRPDDESEKYPTIIWYHGWESDKDSQVFRANILASYGYQVILPDGKHHGERGVLDYEDDHILRKYLLETVLESIDEFSCLYNYIIKNNEVDKDRIALAGHSMGAITAGGIFAHYDEIKTAALFNGTLNWQWLVDNITDYDEQKYEENKKIYKMILELSPMGHIERVANRPLIMLNGEGDTNISPVSQKIFYNFACEKYDDKELIVYNEYPDTNHVITTNMMEDAIKFIKNNL